MPSDNLHALSFLIDRRLPMKFTRIMSFFLFTVICCLSYADENKHIFIGQRGNGELEKTAFILELVEDDVENYVHISENGEVYLKVDKIIAISADNSVNSLLAIESSNFQETVIPYGSRVSPQPKPWKCPYCGSWWKLGEECKKEDCPTNQWKKKKEEQS